MKPETFTLEFLTPCFCAGANQRQAEFRPTAIRGELRWWFRALGGTHEHEQRLFGGVAGKGAASSVGVRSLGQLEPGDANWAGTAAPRGGDLLAYLFFFAERTGRWHTGGALPPNSRYAFQLTIRESWERLAHGDARAAGTLRALWEQTCEAFLSFGSLGFRATRCAGAFSCLERPLTEQRLEALQMSLGARGFCFQLAGDSFDHWREAAEKAAGILKNQLRPGRSAKRVNSPLGRDKPRQTSAVRFRPVRLDGQLRLLIWEAPHERVLSEDSRPGGPLVPTVTL